VAEHKRLYLLEHVEPSDRETFADAVRATALALKIPPDWLMAVMYQESRLQPDAVNLAGSKACGLIQFMPDTIEALNLPADRSVPVDLVPGGEELGRGTRAVSPGQHRLQTESRPRHR
jgi:hypothetical protein